jgi:[acyl-carrier-protein] S-malonyltransferase
VKLAAAAAEGDVCQAANDNEPGQVVISGSKAAIDRAIALAKDFGVRRALPLKVSAPFHCSLMQPAAVAMQKALADIQASAPCVPVVANVLASPISEPGEIKARLVEQVTGTVRWRESVDFMAKAGVRTFVEAGAGKVLSGMARRIAADAETVTLGTPQEIEDFAKKISG